MLAAGGVWWGGGRPLRASPDTFMFRFTHRFGPIQGGKKIWRELDMIEVTRNIKYHIGLLNGRRYNLDMFFMHIRTFSNIVGE